MQRCGGLVLASVLTILSIPAGAVAQEATLETLFEGIEASAPTPLVATARPSATAGVWRALPNLLSRLLPSRSVIAESSTTRLLLRPLPFRTGHGSKGLSGPLTVGAVLPDIPSVTVGCIAGASAMGGSISVQGWVKLTDSETNETLLIQDFNASGGTYIYERFPYQVEASTHGWVLECHADYFFDNFAQVMQREAYADVGPQFAIPDGEYSNPMGWDSVTGFYNFNGQLTGGNFKGRRVREQEAGGGSDGCWYTNSPADPYYLTGGNWPVGNSNIYGYDQIGYGAGQISAARDGGRAPCSAQVSQVMQIDIQGGQWRTYRTNIIRVGITPSGVWAERDGVRRDR